MAFPVISIHAPREGDDMLIAAFQMIADISIHAPREGDDYSKCSLWLESLQISIHAPREGDDSKDAQFYLRIFDK